MGIYFPATHVRRSRTCRDEDQAGHAQPQHQPQVRPRVALLAEVLLPHLVRDAAQGLLRIQQAGVGTLVRALNNQNFSGRGSFNKHFHNRLTGRTASTRA